MRRIVFLFIITACIASCSQKIVVIPNPGDSHNILRDVMADSQRFNSSPGIVVVTVPAASMGNNGPEVVVIPSPGDSQGFSRDLREASQHSYPQSHPQSHPRVAGTRTNNLHRTTGQKTLFIPGTGDSQDILRDLAAAYEQSHPGTDIVIPDSTGSFATKPNTLGGLESAGTRTTVLGRTAVRPRGVDLKKFGPMYYREFARGPVAFVAHKSVPLRQLRSQELCDIYAGHITNWQQLGGPNLPLVVQTRPEGSNMLAIRQAIGCFKDLQVTDNGHLNLRNADAVASLRDMPGSIGFMPLSEAQHHGFPVLKLDGMDPLFDRYPVTISLGLVHMDPLTGLAKDFSDFLATDEAGRLLRQSGHIPVAAPSELVELPRENSELRRLSHNFNQ